MSRPRVLFITIVPSPYQRDLFRALAARDDVDLHVYYMEKSSPDSPWPAPSLQGYEQVLAGFWIPLGGVRWHVNWRLHELESADFVVLSSYMSFIGQWLMRYRLSQQRWLFWGERLRSQSAGWRAFLRDRLAAPLATATGIVGIGAAATDDYRRRFPNPQHFCIPYYCDLSDFLAQERRPAPDSEINFLFCGQMNRRKGVDLLLTAFDRLVNKGVKIRLSLVGREAELPQFLRAISPSARARIHYAGFQPPEHLPKYFSQADVFILPSRYDGWGVVVNQALGAGLPIICTDAVGAGYDLVQQGMNGYHVPAGDSHKLASCMEELIKNQDRILEFGEASRRLAEAFTPDQGAEKWSKALSQLV